MKRVVSVSLGSSKRNHAVETAFLGEKFYIERIGTDGDMNQAICLLKEMDGKVDAFGMGGIDLYLVSGEKRYILRDGKKLLQAVQHTPIVDGSGLKNTLERHVIGYLEQQDGISLKGKKVLLTCALDRFGMAQALEKAGCEMTYGDVMFALGIPMPLRSLKALDRIAKIALPIISQMPFEMLYPTGSKQDMNDTEKFRPFYDAADIVAGDFLYIKRYMPQKLKGKIIITNTVTASDVYDLAKRGVDILVTTTPELNGRSFGTNVMEGVLVALAERERMLRQEDYEAMLERIGFVPRIERLGI